MVFGIAEALDQVVEVGGQLGDLLDQVSASGHLFGERLTLFLGVRGQSLDGLSQLGELGVILTALSLLLPRASITRENRPATLLSLSVTSNSSAISMASENRLSGSFFAL